MCVCVGGGVAINKHWGEVFFIHGIHICEQIIFHPSLPDIFKWTWSEMMLLHTPQLWLSLLRDGEAGQLSYNGKISNRTQSVPTFSMIYRISANTNLAMICK